MQLRQKIEPGKIDEVTAAGAGVLETTASKDVYTFTVPAGGVTAVFDGTGALLSGGSDVVSSSGASHGTVYRHQENDLPAPTSPRQQALAGSYTVGTLVKPDPQELVGPYNTVDENVMDQARSDFGAIILTPRTTVELGIDKKPPRSHADSRRRLQTATTPWIGMSK